MMTDQRTFTVYSYPGRQDLLTVQSDSPEGAAVVWAQREHGSRASAGRVTGDAGKSGLFQSYLPVPGKLGGGRRSVGDCFGVF